MSSSPFYFPPDLAKFVQQELASGKYVDEDDIVFHGLRLLQERERRIADLRQEIMPAVERLQRGEGIELNDSTLDAFFEDVKVHARLRSVENQGKSDAP